MWLLVEDISTYAPPPPPPFSQSISGLKLKVTICNYALLSERKYWAIFELLTWICWSRNKTVYSQLKCQSKKIQCFILTQHITLFSFNLTNLNVKKVYERNILKFLSNFIYQHCVVPEIIHTSPMERIFPKIRPPLWKLQLSFIHFLKVFGLWDPPTHRNFQSLLWGEYGHFLEPHINKL